MVWFRYAPPGENQGGATQPPGAGDRKMPGSSSVPALVSNSAGTYRDDESGKILIDDDVVSMLRDVVSIRPTR